jgi:hypothetical protein
MLPLAQRGVEGYSSEFLAAIDKGLAVMAHERPQSIDAFRELLGIEASGVPRQRSTGNTQRFATLDRLPQTGTADEVTIISLPKTAQPAPAPAAAVKAKPSAINRPAPRWMAGVAFGVALLVVIGFGARWLLSTPSDIIMPATQAEAVPAAVPDASAAPAPAVAAAVEPNVEDILAQAASAVAAAPTPAPAATPAAETPVSVDAILETAPPAADKPDTATYRLAIKPWGTVFVDGKEKGVSPPLKKLVLPSGKHTVRIVNPGFPDYTMDVNLSKGKSSTIEYDFTTRSK